MKNILDRIPNPPGALPAQAHKWLLLGLSSLMLLILVSFPGQANDPGKDAAGSTLQSVTPGSPSQGQATGVTAIDQAGVRMREEAARKAEQRMYEALQTLPPRSDGLPHAPVPVVVHPAGGPTEYSGIDVPSQLESIAAQIAREERLRRYRSLKTPALVQSLRKEAEEHLSTTAAGTELTATATEFGPETTPDPVPPGRQVTPETNSQTPLFVLREGEFMEAVLTNRLGGDFSGPVNALVSTNVYSRSRQHLLVPQGSRVLGTASRVENWEQTRLSVVFHRMILPDGSSVDLDRFSGMNQVGETGFKDRVNRHYTSTIIAAGAVGALAGLTQAVSPQQALSSNLANTRLSAGAGLGKAAERILDRYLNRLPKITIREGHRIRIYLTADLALPVYRSRTAAQSRGYFLQKTNPGHPQRTHP